MDPVTYTLASFLTDVGSIFTAAVGWVGTVGNTIVGQPILLAFTALPLVGLGIGMFKRLLNVQ